MGQVNRGGQHELLLLVWDEGDASAVPRDLKRYYGAKYLHLYRESVPAKIDAMFPPIWAARAMAS